MASSLENQKVSAITLGNAAQVVSTVIKNIAGNDISNTIGESKISNDLIHSLVYQKMMKNFDMVK